MARILFWTASDDGSSWYRADLPAEALTWQGHACARSQRIDGQLVMEADVLIGSRIANEGASKFWCELAGLPVAERPLMVLDLDDAYFALDPRNPATSQWGTEQLDRLALSIAAADVVTVASEGLRDHLRQFVPAAIRTNMPTGWPEVAYQAHLDKVAVVPNGLHAGWLGTPREYDKRQITVGWSGTASSARDFDLVAKSIGNIVNYGAGRVKLRLVGLPRNHPAKRTLQWTINPKWHDLVEAVEWVQHGQEYLSACAAFDVWVAPYRSDPFVDAKFATKALEAGFLGIPLIASDVLPYRRWTEDPGGTLLVPEDKPWMWGRYLKTLVDSPDTRRAIGEAARSRAALNIMQTIGQQWAQALRLDTLLPKEAMK